MPCISMKPGLQLRFTKLHSRTNQGAIQSSGQGHSQSVKARRKSGISEILAGTEPKISQRRVPYIRDL